MYCKSDVKMMRTGFTTEVNRLIGKKVAVVTQGGEELLGVLASLDIDTFSVILNDVELKGSKKIPKVILNGNDVKRIEVRTAILDLRKLAERIERVFPKMVQYNEEAGVIIVMNRIRVTENGVVEGSGLAAEKVSEIYNDFIKESSVERE
ncbi:MAG: Lsm family RNA-binding protein [Candidatus Brockarchaeota archaeon]|nr:Lsm family RNA-binding protein [Candidatus Brockarchaeota archaeon]MBO3808617.1 Lsm family RNA-binding protein [Candidatus Brockarchaeota archaeon]